MVLVAGADSRIVGCDVGGGQLAIPVVFSHLHHLHSIHVLPSHIARTCSTRIAPISVSIGKGSVHSVVIHLVVVQIGINI